MLRTTIGAVGPTLPAQRETRGMTMTTPAIKTLSFSVLVEEQQGAFIGHCLETGLVATALDESDVLSKMSKMLVRQIQFAIENDRIKDIYQSAPTEVWNKWIKTEERIIGQSRRPIPQKEGGPMRAALQIDQIAYAAAAC